MIINKKQTFGKNILFILIGIIILIFLWEICSIATNKPQIFPDFFSTVNHLFILLGKQETYLAMLNSFLLCAFTLIIALLTALFLGTLSGMFNSVNKILTPLITFMKVIPTACVVILLIIFFKSIYASFIVIFLVVFPILYESVVNGITELDESIIDSLKIDGLYTKKSIFNVILPEISPYIYVGIASSFGLGMKVEIMSEILVGSVSFGGIGRLIYLAYAINYDYVELFSLALLTLITFGMIDLVLFTIKKYFKKFTTK